MVDRPLTSQVHTDGVLLYCHSSLCFEAALGKLGPIVEVLLFHVVDHFRFRFRPQQNDEVRSSEGEESEFIALL